MIGTLFVATRGIAGNTLGAAKTSGAKDFVNELRSMRVIGTAGRLVRHFYVRNGLIRDQILQQLARERKAPCLTV